MNFVLFVDFALGRGSYSTGFWKVVMVYFTWKHYFGVWRYEPSAERMISGSTRGISARPGWGWVEVSVAAMLFM